jgi:SpoVK/Ycf46/Vps4 family AAA+-type ATPase
MDATQTNPAEELGDAGGAEVSDGLASDGPSADDLNIIEGLLQSIAGGGSELGSLLLEAGERALKSDNKSAALRLYGMARTAEVGRGQPSSPSALSAARRMVRIHIEREDWWPARTLANELLNAPDRAASKEGERLKKRLAKKVDDGKRHPGTPDTPYAVFAPEPLQPGTTFADVGGMSEAKEAIRRYGILPAQNPQVAERFRMASGGALLLSGPPGCGKTLLAQAAAGEMDVALYVVRVSDVQHPLMGMSERNLANAFKVARDNAPCVLFFDEVDALSHDRSSPMMWPGYRDVTNVFLSEMDGVSRNAGVLVMGATNMPDLVDPALLRPGRFSRRIHVGRPDAYGREAIWRLGINARPMSDDVDVDILVELSDGLTGAEMAQASHEAAEAVWVQCIEDSEERAIGMLDLLVAMRPFVEGRVKHRIDELVSTRWRMMIE